MESSKTLNWACPVSVISGRNVVKTEADGTANVDHVVEMTENVLAKGRGFRGKWAYMPCIGKLDPVLDEESRKAFAKMHERCLAAGCIAFAFVTGGVVAVKVQAKRHQDAAEAGKLLTEYFRTEEEALEWLKSLGI
ncbi:MAG: hypothetical protein Q8942_12125 [Bacillota bacterium]|nr:hypothetical protein [Bacillota bacterium]